MGREVSNHQTTKDAKDIEGGSKEQELTGFVLEVNLGPTWARAPGRAREARFPPVSIQHFLIALEGGAAMPQRICNVCRKPIPDDRHPAARTCSDICMKENYRRTQAEGTRRHRERIRAIKG